MLISCPEGTPAPAKTATRIVKDVLAEGLCTREPLQLCLWGRMSCERRARLRPRRPGEGGLVHGAVPSISSSGRALALCAVRCRRAGRLCPRCLSLRTGSPQHVTTGRARGQRETAASHGSLQHGSPWPGPWPLGVEDIAARAGCSGQRGHAGRAAVRCPTQPLLALANPMGCRCSTTPMLAAPSGPVSGGGRGHRSSRRNRIDEHAPHVTCEVGT
jgi:hypothetical protein